MGRHFHNADPQGDAAAPRTRDFALEELARRLQKHLLDRGWNQSEFARRAADYMPTGKFGRDNISHYITGRHMPGPQHLKAMADALGVKPTDLVPPKATPGVKGEKQTHLTQLADGRGWLTVNRAMPWETAIKILTILAEADRKDGKAIHDK